MSINLEKENKHLDAIAVLYAEDIQSFAETNFGRELTDVELNRVSMGFWEDDMVFDLIHQVYGRLIEEAFNEIDNDWTATDQHFKNEP